MWVVLLLGSGQCVFLWWVRGSVGRWFVLAGLLWCWGFFVFVLLCLGVFLVCRGSVFGFWVLLLGGLLFCRDVLMGVCVDFGSVVGCV